MDDRHIQELRASIEQQPHSPELRNELGIALGRIKDLAGARDSFESALRLRPTYSVAWQNLAQAYLMMGRAAEAEVAALRAVSFAPLDLQPLKTLARIYQQLGRRTEALGAMRSALAVSRTGSPAESGHADAETSLALELSNTFQEGGDPRTALAMITETLARYPDHLGLREQRAVLLRVTHDENGAEQEFRQVIALRPESATARANLAHLLADFGQTDEARQQYAESNRLEPNIRVRAALAATLPILLESRDQIADERERLRIEIRKLVEGRERIDTTRESLPNLFALAYLGENDRWFHEQWANIATSVDWQTQPPGPAVRLPAHVSARPGIRRSGKGNKTRVGVLSRYLRDHTIGRLNIGWMERLPRRDIELVVLPVGASDDPWGRRFRATADEYVPLPWNVPATISVLRNLRLDTLVFLDVGMDPVTLALATSRFAPRQAATWGHPVTTGLPSIDDFISASTAEIPTADEHYSERLVRFEHLGVCYERPVFNPALSTKSAFGISEQTPLLACPQSLFKFHPDFDEVLCRILQQIPTARLALIEGRHPRWREVLENRWNRRPGPTIIDQIVWLPPQPRDRFLGLLKAADVVLDTFPFCGGNSSYETLAAGTPLVTLAKPLLRGRLTAAMYAQMGMTDLVANSVDNYVETVLRLLLDSDLAENTCRQIRDRGPQLFEDATPVDDWERYLTGGL